MKHLIKMALMILTWTAFAGVSSAQPGLGADIVSRYVWRGTDFGNSASVQPSLSHTIGPVEIGAWGSYALTAAGAGFNENDLFIAWSAGPISLTVTDYFYPEGFDIFNYSDKDAVHILEGSASVSFGSASVLGAFNFSGDPDHSFYAELGWDLGEKEGVAMSIAAGIGNHVYVKRTGGDPALVSVSVTACKGPLSVSWILNPDAKTDFLVFGYHF